MTQTETSSFPPGSFVFVGVSHPRSKCFKLLLLCSFSAAEVIPEHTGGGGGHKVSQRNKGVERESSLQ